ncbi:DNA polymerase kappa [Coniella lustricola]|uniref:DNA polymerase kappa n=1 Tax=Coniella lustricola TaxID=2025994 RepID=A0A2T3AAP6_9PEZI|nr:DNA polymerase kappa [Coniella lustricola]
MTTNEAQDALRPDCETTGPPELNSDDHGYASTDVTRTSAASEDAGPSCSAHASLKYSLLGPSLTKAGQDSVDQSKVSEIIYNASKGSKYFNREEERDKALTVKIDRILRKKSDLERLDLSKHMRKADTLIAELELSRDLTQYIVHLDCDAFYAAVEQLDHPELAELPFAVGGGVLTTCNYVARKFGCRSGMAGFVAKKLCPNLVFLPLNFEKYTAKANEVRKVIAEYDPRFESASIDEAYLNITEYCQDHHMTPADAVAQMRREVQQRTNITVSAGIAANAKLAKICSNINKPNGQFVLPSDRTSIMNFMRDLPCRKVNGIGRVWERELAAVGIKNCGDIYGQRQFLNPLFGDKACEFLLQCHLGLGRTNVQPAEDYERKSVGTESTFHEMEDSQKFREKLRWTAEELEKDMRRAGCKGRTLVLKVKLHTYEVLTRQTVTPKAICQADDLYNYALPILAKLEQEIPSMKLRLMGLRCTHLVSTKRPDTLAFFGLKPRIGGASAEPGKVLRKIADTLDDDGWEKLPDELLFESDSEPEPGINEGLSGPRPSPRRWHGKEAAHNSALQAASSAQMQEEWWDCPICSRPQIADERQFNEHIDSCLSRSAIRDAVQRDAAQASPSPSRTEVQEPKRSRITSEKKRGRPPSVPDPKQKKICFG